LLLHPEKEPSLADSEKLACHLSFQMLAAGALCALRDGAGVETGWAVRTAAGLAPTLEARTALQPLTARTAVTVQIIVSIPVPARPSRAPNARQRASRWLSFTAIITPFPSLSS
jgi:hypothetical protein